MASVRENLIAAKALIDTPERWTRGSYEKDGCFCALGAARKAVFGTAEYFEKDGWSGDTNVVALALKEALPEKWGRSVDEFNDDPNTTHVDIMNLFDRAIAASGEQP